MKNYEGTWYNCLSQEDSILKLRANNIEEAYIIAVLVMRFYAGNHYGPEDINLSEVYDDYYSLEEITNRYSKFNRKELSIEYLETIE